MATATTRSRAAPRASTRSAVTARTTTTRGAGRGPGNAPFRLWKRFTWLGGVRTPLVVHWPRRIARGGEVRDAVLPRRRPLPDRARRDRRRAAREVDGVPQRALDGASSCPALRRRARARAARHAVLRDGRQPLALPRRLEGDDRPRRQSGPDRARRSSRAATTSRPTAGRCSDLDATSRGARPRRRRARRGCARWSTCGGPRRAATRCCRSRTASSSRAGAMVRPPFGFRRTLGALGRRRSGRGGRAAAAVRRLRARRGARARARARRRRDRRARRLDERLGGVPARGRPVAVSTCCGDVHRARDEAWRRRGAHELRSSTCAPRRAAAGGARARRPRARGARARARPAVPLADRRRGAARRPDRGFPVCDDYTPPVPSAAPSSAWSSSRFSCYRRTCKRRSRRCSSESERAGYWICPPGPRDARHGRARRARRAARALSDASGGDRVGLGAARRRPRRHRPGGRGIHSQVVERARPARRAATRPVRRLVPASAGSRDLDGRRAGLVASDRQATRARGAVGGRGLRSRRPVRGHPGRDRRRLPARRRRHGHRGDLGDPHHARPIRPRPAADRQHVAGGARRRPRRWLPAAPQAAGSGQASRRAHPAGRR